MNSMFIHDVVFFFSIGQKACSLVYSCPRIQSSTVTVYVGFFLGDGNPRKLLGHTRHCKGLIILMVQTWNGATCLFGWNGIYELCIVYSDFYLYIQYIQYTYIHIYILHMCINLAIYSPWKIYIYNINHYLHIYKTEWSATATAGRRQSPMASPDRGIDLASTRSLVVLAAWEWGWWWRWLEVDVSLIYVYTRNCRYN